MAQDIPVFHVTVPTGTLKTAPLVSNLRMPTRRVDRIQIRVPPGPRGEVGFQLGSSGTSVIPADPATFLVTDGELIDWPLEGFWDSGSWQLIAYNTGSFPHTLEVRFLTSLPMQRQQVAGPLPVQNVDLGPPTIPLPTLPPLPPLPLLPSLLLFPSPVSLAGPAPQLVVVENDRMRYVTITRPDGTKDVFILLSDGSLWHATVNPDTSPNTLDSPPGSWLAIAEAFFWSGMVVLRGVGSDRGEWQITFRPGVDTTWQGPVKVLG